MKKILILIILCCLSSCIPTPRTPYVSPLVGTLEKIEILPYHGSIMDTYSYILIKFKETDKVYLLFSTPYEDKILIFQLNKKHTITLFKNRITKIEIEN